MGIRVHFFDVWQPNYAGATVHIYRAGTAELLDAFFDESLTQAAANPQTLLSMVQNGIGFGKFARPIYVGESYHIVVNSTDETGVVALPLTSLDGEDAGAAVVTVGTEERRLDDLLAATVQALDYGELLPVTNPSASSSTNNATLVAAIGVAAALGGGHVELPAGTYEFTSFTVSPGVIVRGAGEDVTILQSELASRVITLGGDLAGLEDLTVDGVTNQAGSTGVYSKANDELRISRVNIKRLETGLHLQGGQRCEFYQLSIDSCVNGAKLHGDVNASGGSDGSVCNDNEWTGGIVSVCTTVGIQLKYVDRQCWNNGLNHVGFLDNTGIALQLYGARHTRLGSGCWFENNTTQLDMRDGDSATFNYENTVLAFHMDGGRMKTGDIALQGTVQDVVFIGVRFEDGTITLTTVTNNVLALDCTEQSDITLAGGDATKWTRARQTLGDFPGSAGVTTDNVATEAWSYNLAPGEKIHLEAVVIANARNGTDYAMYHIARSANRPGSTLAYDAQTVNYTLGDVITGATSGASARIVADTDAGATGTLTLRDISGVFQDNEIIAGALGGSATVNGAISNQNAALLGSTTSIETAVESDAAFACDFGANADEIRVLVTGNTGKTVEWTVSVKVTSG